jgi:Protein of unknown function (DUF3300)
MKRSWVSSSSILAALLALGQPSCATTQTPNAAQAQEGAQPQPATGQPTLPAPDQAQDATQEQAPAFKPEELEQLVAPVALYPDALLAQVFMASTYPLEVVQAARWSKEHPDVKGDDVSVEMEKQSWDPSVKSLVAFPDVLAMMNEQLDWTQKLGDAFLAQRQDVMNAVQHLRVRAKDAGTLQSSPQQTVTTEPAPAAAPAPQPQPEPQPQPQVQAQAQAPPQTIVIQSNDPQVVYVPTYDPAVVYGAWPYPAYPPYHYYPPGYAAGAAILSFGVGVAVGNALWGGFNWGHGNVDVNVNRYNNFNHNNYSATRNNVANGQWQHNPQHRQGVGYRDTATQQRYARGSSAHNVQSREDFRGRADQGRQQISREGAASQRNLSGNQLGTRGGTGAQSAASRAQQAGASPTRTADASSRARSAGAFNGVGDAAGTRAQSNRGAASRGSMPRGGAHRR